MAGDEAVGRFEAHHPVEHGGHPDGPAGVGTEGERGHAGGDGDGGSAPRAARDPVGVPRVVGLRGGQAVGELVRVRLAQQDGTGLRQARGDRAVGLRPVAGADSGAGRRRRARDVDQIFDTHGDAVQRTAIAAGRDLVFCFTRGLAGSLGGDGDVGLKLRLQLRDALKGRAHQLDGGQLPFPDRVGGCGQGQFIRLHRGSPFPRGRRWPAGCRRSPARAAPPRRS